MPNKLSQFWQELKRRKVIRAITIYAAAAFVILELVSIIVEPLKLPEWTLALVIVLLCIGFIVAIILSWIYDIHPEGLKKTEPVQADGEVESISLPSGRRFTPSDAIIAVLLVILGILVYPKVFKRDKFSEIRDLNGKISIAVMPFENLSGDTLYNVWQGGFQNLLIGALSNSKELSVRQYQAVYSILEGKNNENYTSLTPSLAREFALKLDTRAFIYGNILKAGDNIRVNAQLVNAETEEIYRSYVVEGDSEDQIFRMADSLSVLIRNYLEITKFVEEYDSPAIREMYTNSSEAFQYYIHGYDAAMELDLPAAAEWFLKAIGSDSTFVNSYVYLSIIYRGMGEDKLARKWCNKAYQKRESLPLLGKLMLDHLHAYFYDTYVEQINYIKQILEIDETNTTYMYLLGSAYHGLKQYEDAIIYLEKVLDIHTNWETVNRNPLVYYWLGDSYHQLNKHKREKEVFVLGLMVSPDNPVIIGYQARCELYQGNTAIAEDLIVKYRSIREITNHWSESRILTGLGTLYAEADFIDEAELLYRQALTLDPEDPLRMNDLAWFLIQNDVNVIEGVDLIKRVLKINPDNWTALDTYGWGLYKLGSLEESLQILKDSWDLRPGYRHRIYQHIQEVEQALAGQIK